MGKHVRLLVAVTSCVVALRMPLDAVESLGQTDSVAEDKRFTINELSDALDQVQRVVPTPVENDLLMQLPAGLVLTRGDPLDSTDGLLTVATRIVQGADRNYDNQLNMDEVMEFAETDNTFGNNLKSGFDRYDSSHNGELDVQELTSFVADMQQRTQQPSYPLLHAVAPLIGAHPQARFSSVNRFASDTTETSNVTVETEMVFFDAFAMSSGRQLKSGVSCAHLWSIGALSLLVTLS